MTSVHPTLNVSIELAAVENDLHYVDHVESKLTSPAKEVLSPVKATEVPLSSVNNIDIANAEVTSEQDSFNNATFTDGSLICSEIVELEPGNFLDRQNNFVSVEEREVITSLRKHVEHHQDLHSEAQSLDAVNNNTVSFESSDAKTLNVNLGNEDASQKAEENQDLGALKLKQYSENTGDNDFSMNLIWYSNTVNIDPADLDLLKLPETEGFLTSQLSLEDGYYKAKNQDLSPLICDDNSQKSVAYTNEKADLLKKEAISSAIESASSRFLHVASEMKLEPHSKINENNELNLKPGQKKTEKHPWGLETEYRVNTEVDVKVHDDLPTIYSVDDLDVENTITYSITERGFAVTTLDVQTSNVKMDSSTDKLLEQIIGNPDQFEKETVEEEKYGESLDENVKESSDMSDGMSFKEKFEDADEQKVYLNLAKHESDNIAEWQPTDVELSKQQMEEKCKYEDVADAVGFMMIPDKPTEQMHISSDQSRLESVDINREVKEKQVEENKMKPESDITDNVDGGNKKNEEALPFSGNLVAKDYCSDMAVKIEHDQLLSNDDMIKTVKPTGLESMASEFNVKIRSKTDDKGTNYIDSTNEVVIAENDIEMSSSSETKVTQLTTETDDNGTHNIDRSNEAVIGENKIEMSSSSETTVAPRVLIMKTEGVKFEPFTISRTFKISDESISKIQDLGGLFVETETFVDEYLDDAEYSFILHDCWLRMRNKKFEMKVDAAFGHSVDVMTNEHEIEVVLLKQIDEKLVRRMSDAEKTLDSLIDLLGLTVFVTFEATQSIYQLHDFIVTMNTNTSGFEVGEISAVVNNPADIPGVLRNLENLANKLGFVQLQGI